MVLRPSPAALTLILGCCTPAPLAGHDAGDSGVPAPPDAGQTAEPDAGAEPKCVDDVPLRFSELPTAVDPSRYLGAQNPSVIPWPHYTSDAQNAFGVGEHIEGVQREGRYLLLTGAGRLFSPSTGHLVVIEMGSRSETGSWAVPAYGYDWQSPPPEDRVVALIGLDAASWHAGGMQVSDDVLAVPLYGAASGQSEVRFYDVADPRSPRELMGARLRRPASEAKAVALTRLAGGRYLLMSWDDVTLDFFVSAGARLDDGFSASFHTVEPAAVSGGFQGGGCGVACGTYQNVNFVRQCDGALYFVATRNQEKAAPTLPGDDLASLYRVELDATGAPAVTFVARRTFSCRDQQCSFGAGAGVFVQDATHLVLYGASHWLHGGNSRYNFDEFAAP